MCGILGVVARSPVNQLLYDGLLLLQHRGQDAAGIATAMGKAFHMQKGNGLVRDVFRTRNMRSLGGHSGIAHVRYPTAGSAANSEEAQPFYVNAPFGLMLAHNGNLTNSEQLKDEMFRRDRRHINTDSDSEVLLNVLANSLQASARGVSLDPDTIFAAVGQLHARVRGAYACVAEIAGYGILAFRDPYGIRPLCYGVAETDQGVEYLVASESVALEGLGFRMVRDVAPGEAIFIDLDGNFHARQCATSPSLNPCVFEYVYFARPDSALEGVSVYEARKRLGAILAEEQPAPADVVIAVPDSGVASAMGYANKLGLPFEIGLIRSHYVGRTFIEPAQSIRHFGVKLKLSPVRRVLEGKRVAVIDDSIVRGTTSRKIVKMLRDAGAKEVHLRISSPPTRWPCFYGIDTPSRGELIAASHSPAEISKYVTSDSVGYLSIEGLHRAVTGENKVNGHCDACFSGNYPVTFAPSSGKKSLPLATL